MFQGEFKIIFKTLLPCETSANTDFNIQYNFFIDKSSGNLTILYGNVTYRIPFDDSLTVSINHLNKIT